MLNQVFKVSSGTFQQSVQLLSNIKQLTFFGTRYRLQGHGVTALVLLYAQLTRDLFAIAKFLFIHTRIRRRR